MADRTRAELSEGIYTITLDRPDKRNAIDGAMVDSLLERLEYAELASGVRVVAVRGAGKDFCAGADLKELLASVDRSAGENSADAMKLGSVFMAMRSLPKPVVAVVRGKALAGGCGLATACDIVLASDDAVFGYPEVKLGFVPAMVMAMLRRAVGEKVAFELVASGRLLTAAEALGIGLISRVVPAADLDAGAHGMLTRVAGSSPTALALIKRQLYELDGLSFEDGIRLGSQTNALSRGTEDFKSAVQKFLDR